MSPFEADLEPQTGQPRIRLNLANGWSASIIIRIPDPRGTRAAMAALAACPTGKWATGITELGECEASPEEVISFLTELAARLPLNASREAIEPYGRQSDLRPGFYEDDVPE